MKISRFLQFSGKPEIQELLDGFLFQSDFAQASTLLPPFSRVWTSAIETEVSKKEYISPELSALLLPPTTHF